MQYDGNVLRVEPGRLVQLRFRGPMRLHRLSFWIRPRAYSYAWGWRPHDLHPGYFIDCRALPGDHEFLPVLEHVLAPADLLRFWPFQEVVDVICVSVRYYLVHVVASQRTTIADLLPGGAIARCDAHT